MGCDMRGLNFAVVAYRSFLLTGLLVSASPLWSESFAPVVLKPGEVSVQIAAIGIDRSPATKVTISATIATSAATLVAARAANIALFDRVVTAVERAGGGTRAVRIIATARDMGFDEETELKMFDVGQSGLPGNVKPNPTKNVNLRNRIEVTIPDVVLYAKIRDAVETAGAKFVSQPVYALIDDSAARRSAKQAAIKNAQIDAQAYADALGVRVARIVRIDESRSNDFATFLALGVAGMPARNGDFDETTGQIKTLQSATIEFVLAPK